MCVSVYERETERQRQRQRESTAYTVPEFALFTVEYGIVPVNRHTERKRQRETETQRERERELGLLHFILQGF